MSLISLVEKGRFEERNVEMMAKTKEKEGDIREGVGHA